MDFMTLLSPSELPLFSPFIIRNLSLAIPERKGIERGGREETNTASTGTGSILIAAFLYCYSDARFVFP